MILYFIPYSLTSFFLPIRTLADNDVVILNQPLYFDRSMLFVSQSLASISGCVLMPPEIALKTEK